MRTSSTVTAWPVETLLQTWVRGLRCSLHGLCQEMVTPPHLIPSLERCDTSAGPVPGLKEDCVVGSGEPQTLAPKDVNVTLLNPKVGWGQ